VILGNVALGSRRPVSNAGASRSRPGFLCVVKISCERNGRSVVVVQGAQAEGYALCFATGEGKFAMDVNRINRFEGEIAKLLAERRNLADGSLLVLDFVGQEDWIETCVRISAIDYRLNRIKAEISEMRTGRLELTGQHARSKYDFLRPCNSRMNNCSVTA
jgi:hypothetical protein